jgi:hypothetical protein
VKLTQNSYVITGVGNSPLIPLDTHVNPVEVFGSIIDGGASTYAVHYTTADVFAPGYSAAADAILNSSTIPTGPTTGSKPFNFSAAGATAIQLQVTVGPATVTLGPVFQSDNTLGA